MVRRLHWGCGSITPYGWVNSDIRAQEGVDVVADICQKLPFADEEFDYIASQHALPEISYWHLDGALKELRRVLKTGGVLRLGLPDMDRAIRAYQAKDADYFLVPDEHAKSVAGKMIVQLTWYGLCRCMFTMDFAKELLDRAGFQNIQPCSFRETRSSFPGIVELDNRELESLFIEATK
jgi:predicted SAM-dependent methyltransferase